MVAGKLGIHTQWRQYSVMIPTGRLDVFPVKNNRDGKPLVSVEIAFHHSVCSRLVIA